MEWWASCAMVGLGCMGLLGGEQTEGWGILVAPCHSASGSSCGHPEQPSVRLRGSASAWGRARDGGGTAISIVNDSSEPRHPIAQII